MADWDENGPSDDDIVSQFPQNERAARSAVKTNFGVDHREENDANVGKHETIQMLPQDTPTAVAGQGHFYAKDVGAGVIELFFQDADNNELQLTEAGVLRLSDLLITTAKLADGVLSANTAGRAKMADGYLSADATGRAKMADGFTNTAKLADGALSADSTGRAKMADGYLSADATGRAKMADGYLSADATGRAKMANDFVTQAKVAGDAIYSENLAYEVTSHSVSGGSGEADTWSEETIVAPATASSSWQLISVQLGEYSGSGSLPDSGDARVALGDNGTIAAGGNATVHFYHTNASGTTTAPIRALWLRVS